MKTKAQRAKAGSRSRGLNSGKAKSAQGFVHLALCRQSKAALQIKITSGATIMERPAVRSMSPDKRSSRRSHRSTTQGNEAEAQAGSR